MRVDAHHHVWRYATATFPWIAAGSPIARDFAFDDLAAERDSNGISAAVAVQARRDEAETDALLDLADRHRAIVGVVGWVDLRAPDIDELGAGM